MSRRASDKEPRRDPICDLNAERSVLGAILIENQGLDQVSSYLDARMFFRDAHRKIFEVFVALQAAGRPIDLTTLKTELDTRTTSVRETWLEDVGGPVYIASLVDGVPRSTNVKAYADTVREKWALRELAKTGQWLLDGAYAQEHSSTQLASTLDLKCSTIASQAKWSGGAVTVADSLTDLDRDLERRVERQGQISGWPTGFAGLDLYTQGWQPQTMIVIAGETSFGKSILALQYAFSIAQAGGRVVYYSYEMPKQKLLYRLLSMLSNVPLSAILWGHIRTDAQWEAIRKAKAVMEALPIEINDGSIRTIPHIRSECRQIKADRGLAAVVIDHFQLTENEEGENRVQQLADNSRRIQKLGVELDVCTFTVSQLTLDPKDRRRPQLHDLRECKSLGHEADIVLALDAYKASEARSTDTTIPVRMNFLLLKNRGERLGTVKTHLEREYQRFVECDWSEDAPVTRPKAEKQEKTMRSPAMW